MNTKNNKVLLALALLFFFSVFYYIFISPKNQDTIQYDSVEESKYLNNSKPLQKNTTNNGWYLPFSEDNNLYIPKIEGDQYYKQFYTELLQLYAIGQLDVFCYQTEIDKIFDNYLPLIGINGIIESIEQEGKYIFEAEFYHYIGSYAYAKSNQLQHAVEVSATLKAHGSPLHGVVWSALSKIDPAWNAEQILEFSFQNLCNFPPSELLDNCYHGIGHGLFKLLNDSVVASGICASSDNRNFGYACASGVYMDVEKYALDLAWAPCDTSDFPAACFKYKVSEYDYFEINDAIIEMCNQHTEFHKTGCIWGYGHTHPVESCYIQWNNSQFYNNIYTDFCVHGFYTRFNISTIKTSIKKSPEERAIFCNTRKTDIEKYNCENAEELSKNDRWPSEFLDLFRVPAEQFEASSWRGPVNRHTQQQIYCT